MPHRGSQLIVVDALIATATERAGSDDFGLDTWREGLEIAHRLHRNQLPARV